MTGRSGSVVAKPLRPIFATQTVWEPECLELG